MAALGSHRQSSDAITERSDGEYPVPHTTCLSRVSVRGSTVKASGSSFCVTSVASSLCDLQLAGVANDLIHVATPGELALTRGWPKADNSRLEVGCLASTAHSLPWTPRWSAQCELMKPQEAVCRTGRSRLGPSPPHERTHVPRQTFEEHLITELLLHP